jgi:mono/diheme cytochrome c family protein
LLSRRFATFISPLGAGPSAFAGFRRNGIVQSNGAWVWGAIAALALGCGGGGAEEPSGGEPSGGGEAAYEGPIASTEVDRGKELFSANCDDCHPGGEEDVGPSLIADPHTPARLRQQIREGSGKMKPFPEKRLPNEDMEAILAYLASINAVK